jgi:SacI restriction endonuclease
MSSVSLDNEAARLILEDAWKRVDDPAIVAPARMVPFLEAVIAADDVTFKYLLVTGLLGKCTNPNVHPRALQVSSTLVHSYDARSLCHEVIVTFEKTKGDLFGLSNEPFLNKPARHPEHDKANRQLRNKRLAATLHDALEFAHTAKPEDVLSMLIHVLRLGKICTESQVTATVQVDTNYRKVASFVQAFLQESEGGVRLVAVTGAFVTLLNEGFEVEVHPPNFSDMFAKTAGDIEVFQDKQRVSACECKDRPITLDDIRHGIKKAKQYGVLEYWFVCGSGFAADQESTIEAEILKTDDLDVLLIPSSVLLGWVAVLNPLRRRRFGETVVAILRGMKRSSIANKAGDLWNSIK